MYNGPWGPVEGTTAVFVGAQKEIALSLLDGS